MSMHSGWFAAIGAASVAFFVAADAQAAPVDNPGNFVWYPHGTAEIVYNGSLLGSTRLGGELVTQITPRGDIVQVYGAWGGSEVTDANGAVIVTPTTPAEPVEMRVNVDSSSTGTINAIPGQETIHLNLSLQLRFRGQSWSCSTQVQGSFPGHYTFNQTTGEGIFTIEGASDPIPPISGCGAHDTFINKTFRLGKSNFVFNQGIGNSVSVGPHGS